MERLSGHLPRGLDIIIWAINEKVVHERDSYQLPYSLSFCLCKIDMNVRIYTAVKSNANQSQAVSPSLPLGYTHAFLLGIEIA